MTALDRTLIKAFHRPPSRSGAAVAEPPMAVPAGGARSRATVSPAVPLSQALAELAAVSEVPAEIVDLPSPSGKEAGDAGLPSPFGKEAGDAGLPSPSGKEAGGEGCLPPTTAPVSLSIAAMFDRPLQPRRSTSRRRPRPALRSRPSWTKRRHFKRPRSPKQPRRRLAGRSRHCRTRPTSEATAATVENPLPAEIGETPSVPTEAITSSGAVDIATRRR